MPKIVTIVEGEGEQGAVPILIRRVAEELGIFDVNGYNTIPTQRNRFPRMAVERDRAMAAARRGAQGDGAILVLLDSDGEPPCVDSRHRSSPCILGGDLLREIEPLAAALPVAVIMAEREFEAWFVAAASSLIGSRGLEAGTKAPEDPDSIRDAKGWLTARMERADHAYNPTADQARFTERFDMEMARQRSPSFDRCYREIERLIRAMSQH